MKAPFKPMNKQRTLHYVAVLLILAYFGIPGAMAAQDATAEDFHSVIPLGNEDLLLLPAHKPFYVLASAIGPEFEGWRVVGTGPNRQVLAPDGTPVRYFPERIQFRVTASAHQAPQATDSYPLQFSGDLELLLLNLSFRLEIFDGLQVTAVEPESVQIVGVPPDIPYDERVYQIVFVVGQVPISRRMVLDVRDPDGNRLCKFHLEFE
jgi:hypothetical protein